MSDESLRAETKGNFLLNLSVLRKRLDRTIELVEKLDFEGRPEVCVYELNMFNADMKNLATDALIVSQAIDMLLFYYQRESLAAKGVDPESFYEKTIQEINRVKQGGKTAPVAIPGDGSVIDIFTKEPKDTI